MRITGALRAVLAVGAAAGLVVAAGTASGTVTATRPADVPVAGAASQPAQAQVVCPGPDRPGSAVPDAGQRVGVLSAAAPAQLSSQAGGTASARAVRLPASSGAAPTAPTEAGIASGAPLSGAGAVAVVGSGQLAAGLTATQSSLERTASHRGLSVLACSSSLTTQAWLFAGSDAAGRVVRVVLTNPNPVAVTARLIVVGKDGVDADVSVPAVSVPAASRTVVTLGAFPAALADAAIRVTSSGGPVAVAVSDDWAQGESAVGAELSGSAAPASTAQLIPAVGVSGGAPQVRVVVPGSQAGIVRVRAIGTDGAVVADQVATVPAGTVGRVTLSGIPDGVYDVRVTADQPVVAAAFSPAKTSDFAWSTSTVAISDSSALLLPQLPAGSTATVSLASPDHAAEVAVTTVDGAGAATTRTVQVAGDRPTQFTVPTGSSVWLRVTKGSVGAGAFVRVPDASGDLIAGVGLTRTPLRASDVSVSELVR